MPSCYIHIQYGDIMPLDNTTIGKLNEMTTMINDKSKLDESNIKYVKSLFAELVHEVDKLDMALQASIYAKEGTSSFQNLQVFFDSAKKSINNTEVKSMLDLFLKKLT